MYTFVEYRGRSTCIRYADPGGGGGRWVQGGGDPRDILVILLCKLKKFELSVEGGGHPTLTLTPQDLRMALAFIIGSDSETNDVECK